MYSKLNDIPNYKDWNVIEKVEEGWSKDEKYYIEGKDNNKYLLRISDISMLENKRTEFEILKKLIH